MHFRLEILGTLAVTAAALAGLRWGWESLCTFRALNPSYLAATNDPR